jgi:hypothetical protein
MSCLILGTTACAEGRVEPVGTTPALPTTTASTASHISTTAPSLTTTTTVPDEAGSVSIGVTDQVTIVITTPGDNG